jgi:hypothetical protein
MDWAWGWTWEPLLAQLFSLALDWNLSVKRDSLQMKRRRRS